MKSLSNKQQAFELINKGDLEGARKRLNTYCQRNKDDAEAWFYLGNLCGQLNSLVEAEKCFRRVIEIHFSNPVANFSLAVTLHRLGRLDEAIEYYLDAIRLQPGGWEHHFFLGNAYKDKADLANARKSYEAALSINAGSIELLNNMASVLTLLQEYEKAETYYNNIISINPQYPEAYANLAAMYHIRGLLPQAVDALANAARLSPDNTAYQNRLGMYNAEVARFPEAADSFRKAMQNDPDNPDIRFQLANCLIAMGELDDALEIYESMRKIGADPESLASGYAMIYELQGDHHRALAEIEPYLDKSSISLNAAVVYGMMAPQVGRGGDAVSVLEHVLTRSDIGPADRQKFYFILGNLYDHLERYDDAFSYYRQANDIGRHDAGLSGASAFFGRTAAYFSKSRLQALPKIRIDDTVPIFIVGMPRSGTSLVEKVISSHPDVYGAGELDDILRIVRALPGNYPECIDDISEEELEEISRKHLVRLMEYSGGQEYITDKMPSNFKYLGLIQVLFPAAKIIHCLRDPIDTCLSCYFQDFGNRHPYASDLLSLGEYYLMYKRMMAHWIDVLSLSVHEIRYENLVADQEGETRKLIDFCGLEWDDNCLDYYSEKRLINTASYNQVRQPIYNRSVNRWKNYRDHVRPLLDVLS